MLPDIERLIALQHFDSTAREAERRLAEGPEREKAFDARLEDRRQRVAAAKAALEGNQQARRAIEKDVALHQGRLSKFRDQLMAVKTNVEYQAVQKEIAFAEHEVKAFEDQILERMVEADDLTAAVKHAEAELAAEQKTVDAERKALAADLAAQRDAMARAIKARGEVAAAITGSTLAVFDLVSRRRGGIAVAEARDGICTICHVRLRPQVFNTVRRNEEILQCDSCNRILYFKPAIATAPATGTGTDTAPPAAPAL